MPCLTLRDDAVPPRDLSFFNTSSPFSDLVSPVPACVRMRPFRGVPPELGSREFQAPRARSGLLLLRVSVDPLGVDVFFQDTMAAPRRPCRARLFGLAQLTPKRRPPRVSLLVEKAALN